MKKIILILILFVIIYDLNAQQKGDSLILLNKKIYLYSDPTDLSSRLDKIYNCSTKSRFVYLETSPENSRFYKVKAYDGEIGYIPKKNVSTDLHTTKRYDVYLLDIDLQKYGLKKWVGYAIMVVILIILFIIWRRFNRIDQWFCRKSKKAVRPQVRRWPIKYSLVAGILIGVVPLFNTKEYEWFMLDGFQIWGNYPSRWDWVMWTGFVGFFIIVIFTVLQSLKRFNISLAIKYAIFITFLNTIYFLVGILVGAFVAFFLFFGSGGKKRSGGSYNSGSSKPSDKGPKREKKIDHIIDDDGNRWEENSFGDWERTEKW